MRLEIWDRVRPIAHGEKTNPEIAKYPRNRDSGCKPGDGGLKSTRSKNKYLERRRGRQKRGNQHAAESVALDPVANGMRARARFAVKISFPAHARQKVKRYAAQHRSRRGHQSVERHPLGTLHGKLNEKQVVDDGKRKHRGIQERNEE